MSLPSTAWDPPLLNETYLRLLCQETSAADPVLDSSAQAHTFTDKGSVGVASGLVNGMVNKGCRSFNGTTQVCRSVGTDADRAFFTFYEYSLFMVLQADLGFRSAQLFAYGGGGGTSGEANNKNAALNLNSAGVLSFEWNQGSQVAVTAASVAVGADAFSAGPRHIGVSVARDPSDRTKRTCLLTLDGVVIDSRTGLTATTGGTTSNKWWSLGAGVDSSGNIRSNAFRGRIGPVDIVRRAYSAREMFLRYVDQMNPPASGPLLPVL